MPLDSEENPDRSARVPLPFHVVANPASLAVAVPLLIGAAILWAFIRIQLRAHTPMIDIRLFGHRIILSGVVMAMTAMIALVGFELLMAQELQFVHGFTPPLRQGCLCCRSWSPAALAGQ